MDDGRERTFIVSIFLLVIIMGIIIFITMQSWKFTIEQIQSSIAEETNSQTY